MNKIINELKYRNRQLNKSFGYIMKDKSFLFQSIFKVIAIAVYGKNKYSDMQLRHIGFLTNFCINNLLYDSLSLNDIKKLHLNIFPQNYKSNFIYDDNNRNEKVEITRGEFRRFNTYIKSNKVEIDFVEYNTIEIEMINLVNNLNNTNNDIVAILKMFLEGIRIHPFMNGNGKVFRILFDILLIKNNYYPSLFNICYQQNQDIFNNVIGHYILNNKTVGLKDFSYLLLNIVYKENYFKE